MKNERLFGIVYILLSKDTVTAKELAEYFEVSTRTIYRDIDVLSSLNIPIYMIKGKNGGIRLLENYKLDKMLLTEEEQKELLFSIDGINKLTNNQFLTKMKTFLDKDETSWFEVDFDTWGNSQIHKNHFELLKQAIIMKNIIEFQYHNSRGQKSKRIVEPLRLYFKYNAWYLYGYDIDKKDYRFFKLMRMKEINITQATFNRKADIKIKEYQENTNMIQLVLEIKKKIAYRVYDEFDEENIEILENGDFCIHAAFLENEWLYDYILSFGEYIKVIEPIEVKGKIIDKLKRNLNNYQ